MYSYFFSYYTSKLSFFPFESFSTVAFYQRRLSLLCSRKLRYEIQPDQITFAYSSIEGRDLEAEEFFHSLQGLYQYSSCCRFKINILAQYRWKLWSFFLCSAEAALVRNFEMCRAYVLMAFPNLLLLQLCCHSATGCILALSHCQIL